MKYHCIESTAEFTLTLRIDGRDRGVRIRLWINQEHVPDNWRKEDNTIKALSDDRFFLTWNELADTLSLIEGINAFQVIDLDTKMGFVCYTTPFNDKEV